MRAAQFLAIIGRGSKGSNALENTEDRAGATSEQQDNVINTVNSLDPYGPSWQLVPGNVAAGTVYAQVPTTGTGDLSFTRASTATRTNSAGNIVDVASGVGRIHYRNADGSLSSTGRLLLEPQRTNSIRNSTMVGAVAGSPGTLPTNWSVIGSAGLTQTIVGTGTESGITYLDVRYNGTASATDLIRLVQETNTSIAASNGQTWSFSPYVKITIASGSNPTYALRIAERTAAGGLITVGIQSASFTSTLTRYTYTRTLIGGGTVGAVVPEIGITVTNGATYDFTIRIAAPQMELGNYATTFIPTTTAAVTRLVDAFSLSNIYTNGLISAAGGTWFIDLANIQSLVRTGTSGLFIGDSVSFNAGNQFIIRNPSVGRLFISKVISGVVTSLFTLTTDAAKIAINWNGTTANLFVNGVKQVSATDFTTTIMENMVAGVPVPFYFNEMALLPVPLTDDQCIEMTTL